MHSVRTWKAPSCAFAPVTLRSMTQKKDTAALGWLEVRPGRPLPFLTLYTRTPAYKSHLFIQLLLLRRVHWASVGDVGWGWMIEGTEV